LKKWRIIAEIPLKKWQNYIDIRLEKRLMLRRKIENTLHEWKQSADRKPLVLKGCRQCGKTFSVMQFAKANYQHIVYLNFVQEPELATVFHDSLNVDNIIMNITAMGRGAVFEPGETCLIFDEIQECPGARTSLKFFKLDGRYDVIATGSLLGVRGYGDRSGAHASVPVGYETVVDMIPLDFEEFLWANGINDQIINKLREFLEQQQPVSEALHVRLRQLLLQYTIVGGMPEAVNNFMASHDISIVQGIQRSIIAGYEEDMLKYAMGGDKSKIRECFESIPRQLSKENKKFQYSILKPGSKAAQYMGSLQWIEDAGVINRCFNLELPELPLDGNAIDNVFKVYMADTGLFISMLEQGTAASILSGDLYGYKGAIFENLVADIFGKMGRKLYYYRKDSGLEINFVMRYKGRSTLVEVKATTGDAKSLRTILNHPEKYHVDSAIKLGDYNIGYRGSVLTLPTYMAFLLREY